MAVYTHVEEADLAAFVAAYDFGAYVRSESIAEGVENSNYRVFTDQGRYILTLFERRVREEDLPYFLGLMNHLSKGGLPCPVVYETRSGEVLSRLANRPACLIEHLDGDTIKTPTPESAAVAGDLLGQMHRVGSSFPERRANELSIDGWAALTHRVKDEADTVQAGLGALLSDELAFLIDAWPSGLPAGPIHADLFPDNLMISETGDLTGVIDFYFAAQDSFAYDLAIAVNAWSFNKAGDEFHPATAKRLIESYDLARNLTPREVDAFPILCRGAALRFLLTRLYDWLNQVDGAVVTPKDPRDYLARLNFHQAVKDMSDYVR